MTSSLPNIADATAAEPLPFMPELFKTTAERGTVLIAGRCARCGTYSFPRRSICSRCGPGPNVIPAELDGQGRVYASTVVQVPSPVGLKPPYAYGYVDLDAVPLRVFGLFAKTEAKGMKPGTPVKLIAEPLYPDASGRTLLAYKFARAEGGET
ncbi:Zn-ribbon domain-containing OB-fold protein [Bradyrhizobium genosp. A]|uniref:Zn-ribbon domain-containing OB-fold protein n=1 Tax=Bradyrhizobium genosp. A TaxID=83626 RepID=UPI003CF70F51